MPRRIRTQLLPKSHRTVIGREPASIRGPDVTQTAPPGWTGTFPEYITYSTLLSFGKKSGIDFDYQSSVIGGRASLNGIVADFILVDGPVVLNVQGVYWHYGIGPEAIARDKVQRGMLESMGYIVVFLDEDSLLLDPSYYVREGMAGRDHSRIGRGVV